ncbi:MAG: PIN domain-containing protein [Candidatus Longimicrobiales bacterium M2_2A_002]
MTQSHDRVVIDTSVFVGAGFSPDSAAGATVQAVRDGRLRMPWTEDTRNEVKAVLESIPPLDWPDVEGLFRDEDRYGGDPDTGGLQWVEDPDDRKFAALARAADAALVSNDGDFLARRDEAGIPVYSSREFADRL